MPDVASNDSLNSIISGGMRANEALASSAQKGLEGAADRYKSGLKALEQERPAPAKLQDLPDRPKVDYGNPWKVFRNYGVLLALVASAATRTPLTAAFSAAAGALNGYRQGKMQQAEEQEQAFKDAMDKVLTQNEIEVQRYKESRDKYEDDLASLQAQWQADAAIFKDAPVIAAIRHGDMAVAATIIRDKERAGRVLKTAKKAQEKAESESRMYDTAISEIDKAVQMAKDPDVVGLAGKASKYFEGVKGVLARGKPIQTPAKDFENQVTNIQAQIRNLVSKSHYMSAGAAEQLEKLVPGEDWTDSPDSTIRALENMKSILESERGKTSDKINSEIQDSGDVRSYEDNDTSDPSQMSDDQLLQSLGLKK